MFASVIIFSESLLYWPTYLGVIVLSPLSVRALLTELHQAALITREEKKSLNDVNDVVRVQRAKSHALLARTAEILRRHGFEKEPNFLSGKEIPMHFLCCLPYLHTGYGKWSLCLWMTDV